MAESQILILINIYLNRCGGGAVVIASAFKKKAGLKSRQVLENTNKCCLYQIM
jgi:hypothetical protein